MKNLIAAVTTTIAIGVALVSPALAATYGGDATGAEVTVSATGTTIRAATGTLSISGGMAHAALPSGDIPGSATGGAVSLAASAMHSAIVGSGGTTRAEASTGGVSLTVSGNQLTTDFVMARSAASCGPSTTGSSELTNLVINGQSITVTGAPNQTVSLPNGTAIINSQTQTLSGAAGELVVIALRVLTHDTLTGQPIADAAVAVADAKIDCSGGTSATNEFVTGGGWIPGNSGGKATFGFVAGSDNSGGLRGHFTLKDHSTGQTVHLDVIELFTACAGSGTSTFVGSSTTTGDSETVTVSDVAEPGRDNDQFRADGTYTTVPPGLQTLLGGNIQNHGFACP
jgi:hypothetical protein